MSLKHKQVSRATKLARRANVRQGTSVVFVPKGVKIVHGKVIHPNPHVQGAKEQERAKRLSKSMFLNERGSANNPRVSPTLCQHAKV